MSSTEYEFQAFLRVRNPKSLDEAKKRVEDFVYWASGSELEIDLAVDMSDDYIQKLAVDEHGDVLFDETEDAS